MCVPRPHPVGDSWGAIIGTLSKEVGLLCQPKLSSSSQIPLGNWRNDTLPSWLTAKDHGASSGRRILKAHEMKEARDLPMYVFSDWFRGWGGGSGNRAWPATPGILVVMSTPRADMSRRMHQAQLHLATSESRKSNGSRRKPCLVHPPRINQKLLIARS